MIWEGQTLESGRPAKDAGSRIGVDTPRLASGSGEGEKKAEAKTVWRQNLKFLQLLLKMRPRFQAWVTGRMVVTETNQIISTIYLFAY